jgi:hypothetical protein
VGSGGAHPLHVRRHAQPVDVMELCSLPLSRVRRLGTNHRCERALVGLMPWT